MPNPVGQLGPLPEDLPTERAELACALRGLWGHLGVKTSVREYAGKQNLAPSSVSRYLKGDLLPPENFLVDLVDAVELELGNSLPGEAERVLVLLHAAQDAQSGTWGSGKRWRTRCLHLQHRVAVLEQENVTISEENRWLTERVAALEGESAAIQVRLDPARLDDGHPRIVLAHELAHWYVQGSTLSYWPYYARSLEAKGWADSAITGLDAATTEVLERLADPLSQQPRPIDGTVIHYPGSGHTSNVVGLIAKAVDVGYRLVIVLAGAQNVVRRRVQQRLDDGLPSLPDTAGVIRLTDPDLDYRNLRGRLSQLEFEKQRPDLPLNASENLRHAAVRLIVVKKNTTVLRKLRTDLLAIKTPLNEIPALLVDLEVEPDQQGTAVASHIDRLVEILPRAQRVAYTSRPLPPNTDVVIGGDNLQSTKNFVVASPPPDNYVGAREFYDPVDSGPLEHRDLATSGERAYVRRVDQGDVGLLEAMDIFVLSAAMKLHRDHGESFVWHTMLVQTSARRATQGAMRDARCANG